MDKGQDETSAGKHHDLSNPKNGQEAMNHFAHMHTCIHKANIFFSGNRIRNGVRYTVFCGSQELKPSRHEESKGRRSRQGGEPRLKGKTLGKRSTKN